MDFKDFQTNSGSGGKFLPAVEAANATTGNTDDFPTGTIAYVNGTAPVTGTMQGVDATHGLPVQIVAALPAGTAVIGHVIVDSVGGTVAVTGTFWQATQPVSIASLPALPAGTNVIGHVIADSIGGTVAVTGTFWQATQPVSVGGTVAVSGTFWQATQPVSITLTPVKTIQTQQAAWQDIASAAQVLCAAVDVSTVFAASFAIQLARLNGTAFTLGWPKVRIEAAFLASGNNAWVPIDIFQAAVGASVGNTTANGAISAGATACTLTSGTNFVAGDLVFLGHTTTAANYELVRCKAILGTTLTFEEACTNSHDNGCVITTQAEAYFPIYDLSAYKRVRVVLDNSNSGQGIKALVALTTEDSVI